MPYVTQSRRTQKFNYDCEYKLAAWSAPLSSKTFYLGNSIKEQTTYSYRSGRAYGGTAGRYGGFDNGHDFDTYSYEQNLSHKRVFARNVAGSAYFRGPLDNITPSIPVAYRPTLPSAWAKASADQIGSRFISATAPTKPAADLSVALGELILDKGIAQIPGRMLLSDKMTVFRKAGSEYLNVQFGWLPFVADLNKVLFAVRHVNKILQQYERDSGRNVRRRRSSDPVTTSLPEIKQTSSIRFPVPSLYLELCPVGYQNGSMQLRHWDTVTYSFSAAYTYYLETGGDLLSDLKRFEQLANKLLGIRLTPEVLWELMPFSWLIDWVADVGVLMTNISRFADDQLVLRYSYVMRHVESWTSYVTTGIKFHNFDPGAITKTEHYKRKSRVKGTPYGFGLNPSGFSARQWATLAALGLANSPRGLR